jgi:hypothetical protein
VNHPLDTVAESQAQWSATATAHKSSFERTRALVFALSILAALLAAVASQRADPERQYLAVASAMSMGLATFLTGRLLNLQRSQIWVRARAASEALKREAFKFAAEAAPFDDPATRNQRLREETERIVREVDDLLSERADTGASSIPRAAITADEYIAKRVTQQIDYHEKGAKRARASARKFRQVEFVLGLGTAIITGVLGVIDKENLFRGFDLVALTAVFTTLAGMILAYVEASRYDFIVSSYRVTARRLRDLANNPPANPQPGTPAWSAFVEQCEAILQDQNSSWIAKFSKPMTTAA